MTERSTAPRLARLARFLPAIVGLACLWLLLQEARALDFAAVMQAAGAIPAGRWAAALMATAGSFWAIAQYDRVAHGHFDTGIAPGPALAAGAASIALGQALGFGPLVGAAVRWRLMPGLGRNRALHITGFVTLGFVAVWTLLAASVAAPLVLGVPWLALLILPLTATVATVLVLYPRIALRGSVLRLPGLPAVLRLGVFCLADMLFAAVALWVLLPEAAMPFAVFAAAFALALGAGLLAGTPGGVGPFELALLSLLPDLPAAPLAAGLVAFRACHGVAPALLAALYVLTARPVRGLRSLPPPPPLRGPRPEHAIAAQSEAEGLEAGGARACLLRLPGSLVLFLGPVRGPLDPLLPALVARARATGRVACLYKATARDAVRLRRAGWLCMPLATEAVIDVARFDTAAPGLGQMRRALRKAAAAGIAARAVSAPDGTALLAVQRDWLERTGRERGLTMGRFCLDFLADKPVFGAWQSGRLVGFCSFTETAEEWSLDLLRLRGDAPAGTAHALVAAALAQAKTRGVARLSLAALPDRRLRPLMSGTEGLARFKTSFGPRHRPLYIAAPGPVSLTLAALDLWRAIHAPAPLPRIAAGDWQAAARQAARTLPARRQTG